MAAVRPVPAGKRGEEEEPVGVDSPGRDDEREREEAATAGWLREAE